jgi:hypothetical protein
MSRSRRPIVLIVLVLNAVFLMTGCGSGASTPPPVAQAPTATTALAPTAPAPTASAPTPLPTVGRGPLTCTAPTGSGFPKGGGGFYATDQSGRFVDSSLQGPTGFSADGSFNRAGTLGCYTLDHQQIVMIDEVGTFQACPLVVQTGLYTWGFDGTLLSFTRVNDACSARFHALTTYKWKRQP